MRRYIVPAVIAALILLNLLLLLQNRNLKDETYPTSSTHDFHLVKLGDVTVDMRGAYTMPGFGSYFVSRDSTEHPVKAPLTLAIFFSAATTSPCNLSETAVFRRLVPVFHKRGQKVVAVTSIKDSAEIAEFLEQEQLDIPITALDETWETSDTTKGGAESDLACMGISPFFMPFKILYDSTFASIYMSGINNTLKSQADFEAAMMRLSDLVAGE
ncbi:MAG: hypothetical protein U9N55_09985 [candidate division Zixibacteria bacterium]|nr:hypothetical protein [candidate division Zixibacteria bacterium]